MCTWLFPSPTHQTYSAAYQKSCTCLKSLWNQLLWSGEDIELQICFKFCHYPFWSLMFRLKWWSKLKSLLILPSGQFWFRLGGIHTHMLLVWLFCCVCFLHRDTIAEIISLLQQPVLIKILFCKKRCIWNFVIFKTISYLKAFSNIFAERAT